MQLGECTARDGRCVRGSEADCLQGEYCQREGQCGYDAERGLCVDERCAKTPGCRQWGRCKLENESCVPTAEGCTTSSIGCTRFGSCGPPPDGPPECDADEASCRASAACRALGECGVDPGEYYAECAAKTTRDCMESQACKRDGRCQRDEARHACWATAGGCKRSEACRVLGLCDLAPGAGEGGAPPLAPGAAPYGCYAGSDAACAAAKACKDHGACAAFGGVCASAPGLSPPSCKEVEVLGLTATASTEHRATPPYRFEAAQLVDRDLRTSWQPASKKGGVGEKLQLHLPRRARLARLAIANGFQRRDQLGDLWLMNNRVRQLAVRAGGVTVVVPVADVAFGFSDVALPPVETDSVEVEILGVEDGTRWKDLALSELRVYACE
ncbi:MAG: hypothetical protein CVU56_11345 [Deltaproteobacteria bacterium HGW-Deltaproteobacteria-14]|nr:MAG: hypothetical protein CVU56_11345 [Deltaproteobacteria bacterium HGW-Deltaproteobacteria-14]